MTHTSITLLEKLRTQPDEAAWQRLDNLYRPLIRRWLLSDPTLRDVAEDLVQEVLTVVVRELPHFQHEHAGSFRGWLRTITWNRLQAFWQTRQRRPQLLGSDSDGSILSQLEDPHSALSRQWDEEHDRHIVRRLMELIEARRR